MHPSSLHQTFITLFMAVMLIDAASLTTPREFAKNVSDMISGKINSSHVKATKSKLLENDKSYFYALLGVPKNTSIDGEPIVLPNEIGSS